MSIKSYFCHKCRQKHRYTSKIGTQHLNYRIRASLPVKVKSVQLKPQPPKQVSIVTKKPHNKIIQFFLDYRISYKNGVEKFGVWWTIFQLSIWSLAVIFLLTAAIIFVVYLPKVEMINW